MTYSASIVRSLTVGSDAVTQTITKTAENSGGFDLTIPDSTTDQQVLVNIDVSALAWFYLHTDQAITVETNDGTTPASTFTPAADIPYLWTSDDEDTFAMDDADITSFYITNASGSTATVKIRYGQDSTP